MYTAQVNTDLVKALGRVLPARTLMRLRIQNLIELRMHNLIGQRMHDLARFLQKT